MSTRAIRWSGDETERYWGPFTWSPSSSYRSVGIGVKSAGEESAGPYLRVSLGGPTLLVKLPRWVLRPRLREKEFSGSLSDAEIMNYVLRTGKRTYTEVHPREYSVDFHEDAVHYHYGVQMMSWGGEDGAKSGCWFYPWRCWREVERRFYDRELNLYTIVYSPMWKGAQERFEAERIAEEATPTRTFALRDFDGEVLAATLRLEERESACGEGRWRWLSWFVPNRVSRSFDIRFSAETGPEKGSWKGGVCGTGITALHDSETHEEVIRRYCAERATERGKHRSRMELLHEV